MSESLSPWGMFLHADIVVQLVICGLALASVLTWTIWLGKTLELAAREARECNAITPPCVRPLSLHASRATSSPRETASRDALVREASDEWQRSSACRPR